MLIKFSVKNFKTFRDKAELSLIASNYDKSTREEENVIEVPQFNLRLLKSAVMYGANASGKSRLVEAMMFMRGFVIESSKDKQKDELIKVAPFKLQVESENEPSEFEVTFIHHNEMFRYGFETTTQKIVSEWLYHRPKTKEIELFYRDYQNFESIHKTGFKRGDTLVKDEMVRENALMLSVAAQFNDTVSGHILDWFKKFRSISGVLEEGYSGFTVNRTERSPHKKNILNLLKAADLGIQDIFTKPLDVNKLPADMPVEMKDLITTQIKNNKDTKFVGDLTTIHKKYDNKNKHVSDAHFSINDESSGTEQFFYMTGPILATLEEGTILVIDEMGAKIHPNLVCKLIALFNSKEANPKKAQLIFNTHDTNLLRSGLFRRDQIWFIQKDRYGAASLYPLTDFADIRKNENFEDNYVEGKYGAVPYLGNFDTIVKPKMPGKHENEK